MRGTDGHLALCDRRASRRVRRIPRDDSDYPATLAALTVSPASIYLAGTRARLRELLARPVVALVGGARSTYYGRELASKLAAELASAGVTVIAGLTEGIEAAAHHGALARGAGTIAVLPAPPSAPYPVWQRHLHARVLACGCAISDAAAGLRPPSRERRAAGARATVPAGLLTREVLLAAMAEVTVVVEATRGAGALRTAEAALELGRAPAAVPGRTSDVCAAGPNVLIRDGAHVVLEAADVLALLQLGRPRERRAKAH